MRTTARAEITFETHRVLIVRGRGSLLEGWCAFCARRVATLLLEEAEVAGISAQSIRRQIEAGRLHFTADGGVTSFICLNSLLE